MKTYTNISNILLAFSHDGKDYIVNPGEEAQLPACDYVNTLEAKGYISKTTNKKK